MNKMNELLAFGTTTMLDAWWLMFDTTINTTIILVLNDKIIVSIVVLYNSYYTRTSNMVFGIY